MVYDFDEQLKKGKEAEKFLDGLFSKLGFYIEKISVEEEKKFGFDRIFTSIQRSTRFSVEYKTDFQSEKTGNAFIEIDSVSVNDGWALRTLAQVLIYYVPYKEIYIVSPTIMKKHLHEWYLKYPTVYSQNKTYASKGILVPLAELQLCGKILDY